jgi:hypothetical protein
VGYSFIINHNLREMFHVKQYKDYTAEDWTKLTGWGWYWLLEEQPQFSIHCDWNKLDEDDWYCLLRAQPKFSIHCNWEALNGKLSVYDWRCLLIDQPHLKPIAEYFT